MIVSLAGRVGSARASGDPEALHLIYSITKSFVGTSFVALAEAGRLTLDDSVCDWLDDERLPDVTLRQLLNHTSGIADYGRLPDYHDAVRTSPSNAWSDEELLERALALGVDFAPGKGWAYSNTGFLLLRRILDRFGGVQPTLDRLGLVSTSVAERVADLHPLVPGDSQTLGGDVRGQYDPRWVGHRTLISNCVDIHRFVAWLVTTPVADPASFVEVGQAAYGFVRPSYGLGVMADPANALGVVIGHGGGGPGYATAAFAVVAADGEPVAAVALSNQESPTRPIEEVALGLLRDACGAHAGAHGAKPNDQAEEVPS